MTFFDTVKGTVNTAADTISNVTQNIVEKNRTNAKLNRLRLIMKCESELMNRAYIALGKSFYENTKKGESVSEEQQKKLFEVIENSKAKIAKARECYRQIVDSSNDIFYGTPETQPKPEFKNEEVVDITVACSNENEYKSSPFEAQPEKKEEPAKEVQNEPVKEEVKTEEKKSVDREMEALKAYVNKLSQREAKDESLDADTETDDKELF